MKAGNTDTECRKASIVTRTTRTRVSDYRKEIPFTLKLSIDYGDFTLIPNLLKLRKTGKIVSHLIVKKRQGMEEDKDKRVEREKTRILQYREEYGGEEYRVQMIEPKEAESEEYRKPILKVLSPSTSYLSDLDQDLFFLGIPHIFSCGEFSFSFLCERERAEQLFCFVSQITKVKWSREKRQYPNYVSYVDSSRRKVFLYMRERRRKGRRGKPEIYVRLEVRLRRPTLKKMGVNTIRDLLKLRPQEILNAAHIEFLDEDFSHSFQKRLKGRGFGKRFEKGTHIQTEERRAE